MIWQDYYAGLNPTNVNATFGVQMSPVQTPPQFSFNTVVGRNYRIEWSTSLAGPWSTLRDGIAGTGGSIGYTDQRNLSTVSTVYYRVAVGLP